MTYALYVLGGLSLGLLALVLLAGSLSEYLHNHEHKRQRLCH